MGRRIFRMNLFSMMPQRDTMFHKVNWHPANSAISYESSFNADPKKHYIFNGLFIENPPEEKHTIVFYPQSFYKLADILMSGGNQIYSATDVYNNEFKDNRKQSMLFRVRPNYVDCGEPYPTYASIAQHRPADLHFFKKFADADFYLVTETFVDRVKAT